MQLQYFFTVNMSMDLEDSPILKGAKGLERLALGLTVTGELAVNWSLL